MAELVELLRDTDPGRNGRPSAESVRDDDEGIELDSPLAEVPDGLPATFTARELCALPDPPESDMLLGPLAVRGARTIVVGDTGHGKTSFVLQIAGAILTGRDMLGYKGAGCGPVLVVDLEQGIRSIKRALRDADLADRDDLIYWPAPDGLALDDEGAEDWLTLGRLVVATKPAVLVLDPYYKAHRADANEERAVVDLMRRLDALRAAHRFALILPAHPRKDPSSQAVRKLSLHDVAGSGAVTRGAEVVLGLERLSHGYARLRILKDRDGDLPVGEAWPLLFSREEGFRLDPKESQTEDDLEQRIVRDPGEEWRTDSEWATELGIRRTRARELLDRLVASGDVEMALGPAGRHPRARCYRTRPGQWDESGRVSRPAPDSETRPTRPTLIGSVDEGRDERLVPDAGRVDAEERDSR